MKYCVAVLALIQICGLTLAQDHDRDCNRCSGQLELGIVFDSSSSISRDDFKNGQAFLQSYLRHYDIGPNEVRVSIITYGRTVHAEDSFNLTTYNSNSEVADAISGLIHHATAYTATGAGIRFMREYQLAPMLVRSGVTKVGVVITDGNSQETKVTAQEAEKARDQGIIMYAIGVGQEIDHQELLNIAGNEQRVGHVDSYAKLAQITDWLAKEACARE